MTDNTRLLDFPDAPAGSYVCEEGWLIVGDEAWTAEEWRASARRPHSTTGGRPRLYDDYAHHRMRQRKLRSYYAHRGAA